MALLNIGSPSKGAASTVLLDKTELITLVTDPYFQDSANWSSVVVSYQSNPGNQKLKVRYTPEDMFVAGQLSASSRARDVFELTSIFIYDFDGDSYRVPGSLIGSSFDIQFTASGGLQFVVAATGYTYNYDTSTNVPTAAFYPNADDISSIQPVSNPAYGKKIVFDDGYKYILSYDAYDGAAYVNRDNFVLYQVSSPDFYIDGYGTLAVEDGMVFVATKAVSNGFTFNGTEYLANEPLFVVLKNNVLHQVLQIPSGQSASSYSLTDMTVVSSVVYCIGNGPTPVLWTDGVPTVVGASGQVLGIAVSPTGDIHIAGSNAGLPTIWTNGVTTGLSTNTYPEGIASRVVIDGAGQVVVVGDVFNSSSQNDYSTAYWVNGVIELGTTGEYVVDAGLRNGVVCALTNSLVGNQHKLRALGQVEPVISFSTFNDQLIKSFSCDGLTVYATGDAYYSGVPLWVNADKSQLLTLTAPSTGQFSFKIGNDTYVFGSILRTGSPNSVVMWKNFAITDFDASGFLPPFMGSEWLWAGTDGTDWYAVFRQVGYGDTVAVLKNGTVQYTWSAAQILTLRDFVIHNGALYVLGATSLNGLQTTVVITNGSIENYPPIDEQFAGGFDATSLYFSGQNMYVTGTGYTSNGDLRAGYLVINGGVATEVVLETSLLYPHSEAHGIAVSGTGDVIVCGDVYDTDYNAFLPCKWVNGTFSLLPTGDFIQGYASTIAITTNGDVHISASQLVDPALPGSSYGTWVNDVLTIFTVPGGGSLYFPDFVQWTGMDKTSRLVRGNTVYFVGNQLIATQQDGNLYRAYLFTSGTAAGTQLTTGIYSNGTYVPYVN